MFPSHKAKSFTMVSAFSGAKRKCCAILASPTFSGKWNTNAIRWNACSDGMTRISATELCSHFARCAEAELNLASRTASARGARRICVDIDDEKLVVARAARGSVAINTAKESLHDRLQELTEGRGSDVANEAIRTQQTFRAAIGEVAFTGRSGVGWPCKSATRFGQALRNAK